MILNEKLSHVHKVQFWLSMLVHKSCIGPSCTSCLRAASILMLLNNYLNTMGNSFVFLPNVLHNLNFYHWAASTHVGYSY